MVKACAACGEKASENRSLHIIPKNLEKRIQWCKILKLCVTSIAAYTFVCSDHFCDKDKCKTPTGIKVLKKNALPIPLPTSTSQITDIKTEPLEPIDFLRCPSPISTCSTAESPITVSSPETADSTEIAVLNAQNLNPKGRKRYRYFGDCDITDLDNPRKAKRSWEIAKKTILVQRKKIATLQKTKRRMRARITSLNKLVESLVNSI